MSEALMEYYQRLTVEWLFFPLKRSCECIVLVQPLAQKGMCYKLDACSLHRANDPNMVSVF